MKLVSIVVPIYNMETYLKTCLDTIRTQTLRDIEIILVNDGSSDNSLVICREYANIDNRIKVIDKQNEGVSSAWIAGVKEASGEYVGFVDPDDYVDNDYFETLYSNVKKANADMIVCGYTNIIDGKATDKIKPSLVMPDGCVYGERLNFYKRNFYNPLAVLLTKWVKLIKTEIVLGNLPLYDTRISLGDDMGITMASFYDANKVVIMNNYYGYKYRINNNSITHRFSRNLIVNYGYLCENIREISKSKGYYDESIEDEMYRQLKVLVGMILFSDESNNIKKEYLKELRADDMVIHTLKRKNNIIESKAHKIMMRLFKKKMYNILLLLVRVKKR